MKAAPFHVILHLKFLTTAGIFPCTNVEPLLSVLQTLNKIPHTNVVCVIKLVEIKILKS